MTRLPMATLTSRQPQGRQPVAVGGRSIRHGGDALRVAGSASTTHRVDGAADVWDRLVSVECSDPGRKGVFSGSNERDRLVA